MNHRLLFSALLGLEWAIDPERARALLDVVITDSEIEAVEKRRSRPMDAADEARQRDGVAIVSVRGPITRYADSWAAVCGATSVETLAKDFDAALNNPNVGAILLNVDSPGGEVNGIAEFAQQVFEARGKKPIVAYVGGMGASAAYWIASAADEIIANDTAMLGSIGVVAAVPNPDAKSARDLEFVSSQSPNKRPNPNTEVGRAQIQGRLDDLADVFIGAVARNRGVSAETVQAEFGQGGVMVGAKAVEAGLADRLGSFEETLAELAAGRWQRKPKTKPMASAEITEETTMTMDEIKAAMTETVNGALAAVGLKPKAEGAADADRIAAAELEAKQAKEALANARKERLETEAATFVSGLVAQNKLLPADADAAKADYLRAALDDEALPVASGEATRLQRLKTRAEAQAPHKLTEELVVDDKTIKTVAADKTGAAAEVTPERKAELLSLTPLGQVARQGK